MKSKEEPSETDSIPVSQEDPISEPSSKPDTDHEDLIHCQNESMDDHKNYGDFFEESHILCLDDTNLSCVETNREIQSVRDANHEEDAVFISSDLQYATKRKQSLDDYPEKKRQVTEGRPSISSSPPVKPQPPRPPVRPPSEQSKPPPPKPSSHSSSSSPSSISDSLKFERNLPNGSLFEVPAHRVSQIIGTRGSVLFELQARTGCTIGFAPEHNPGKTRRYLQILGSPVAISSALSLISKVFSLGPSYLLKTKPSSNVSPAVGQVPPPPPPPPPSPSLHFLTPLKPAPPPPPLPKLTVQLSPIPPQPVTKIIECSQQQVGPIIGLGGANVKELETRTSTRIIVNQDFPPDVPRQIKIIGTPSNVEAAVSTLQSMLHSMGRLSSSSPITPIAPAKTMNTLGTLPPLTPVLSLPSIRDNVAAAAAAVASFSSPDTKKTVLDLPKLVIGKVIGRGGETIQLLQRKSGCHILIDQLVPEGTPCKVTLTGTAAAVSLARHMINEILIGVSPHKLGQTHIEESSQNARLSLSGLSTTSLSATPSTPQPHTGTSNIFSSPSPAYPAYPNSQLQIPAFTPFSPFSLPHAGPNPQYSAPPPTGWVEYLTPTGQSYWHNPTSGKTQWERP